MPDFDLRQYALDSLKLAKQNLESDGYLTPLAIVVTGNDLRIHGLQFQGEQEKIAAYDAVIADAKEHNAQAIITVNDCNVGTDDPEWLEGYYWGRLRAEGAPDAIMVTVSGPAVPTWTVIVRYSRNGKKIVFEQEVEETGGSLNLLAGWASDQPLKKN